MKNILCYGDSNTWGFIAGTINRELKLAERFDYYHRWPGILHKRLGDDFKIIEAGLNGRTTIFDEALVDRPSRNGLATLPGILEMHYPLSLVIFMLGTNDVKIEFNATTELITAGMRSLIHMVKSSHFGPNYSAPKIMLISPSPVFNVGNEVLNLVYNEISILKSKQISNYYADIAEEERCIFLDAAKFVKISQIDGVHFEPQSHFDLANAIVKIIEAIKW